LHVFKKGSIQICQTWMDQNFLHIKFFFVISSPVLLFRKLVDSHSKIFEFQSHLEDRNALFQKRTISLSFPTRPGPDRVQTGSRPSPDPKMSPYSWV